MKTSLLAFLLSGLACLSAGCSGGGGPRNDSASNGGVVAPSPQTATAPARDNLPKIVALGDSLTAGYGLADVRQSYPALLQKKLDADGYQYEVINAGVSGGTSAGGLRNLDWALAGDVRFVIVELGANDHLRGQPVAETRKNLSEIIRRARGRGAEVILAGMLTTANAGDRYLREIADMYTELAREHKVTLIPFFLEGVAGIDALNLEDRVHPN
ncbi:MAG TPA: arylesterase, partial [Pyrinomonadaceae bacterium]